MAPFDDHPNYCPEPSCLRKLKSTRYNHWAFTKQRRWKDPINWSRVYSDYERVHYVSGGRQESTLDPFNTQPGSPDDHMSVQLRSSCVKKYGSYQGHLKSNENVCHEAKPPSYPADGFAGLWHISNPDGHEPEDTPLPQFQADKFLADLSRNASFIRATARAAKMSHLRAAADDLVDDTASILAHISRTQQPNGTRASHNDNTWT